MPISAATGGAASDSTSVASLALSSFTMSAGRHTVVVAVLGSTASAVSSITDTKGNTYALQSACNGTGVRIEIWACVNSGAQAGNVVTINVSPNTPIAGAVEEYSGVGSFGNTAAGAGSSIFPELRVSMQEGDNFVIGGIGFACQSGDTLTAFEGTSRRFSIPAATAVGAALYDNSSVGVADIPNSARISSARDWAMAALELRAAGGVAVPYRDYEGRLPVTGMPTDKETRMFGTMPNSGRAGGTTIYTLTD